LLFIFAPGGNEKKCSSFPFSINASITTRTFSFLAYFDEGREKGGVEERKNEMTRKK
jgi:hypothetical protein